MVTKIMALGASNTYGMYQDATSPGGYRGPLQYMLQSQGVSYDFVGLDRDGAIADADHNGYSGKRIEWFTNPVNGDIYDHTGSYSNSIYSGSQSAVQYMINQANLVSTDVVLLLAGTNNVIAGDSAETMLAKMDVLLQQIVGSSESPTVMLMKLQVVGGDWWADGDDTRSNNDTIRIFNEGLATLAANYEGVTLVGNGTTEADLSTDGVHLSEAGYRKTADAWFDALMASGELDFGTSLPQLVATTAREGGAVNGVTLIGAKKADKLTGTSANDKLDGGAGADTMTGLGGDDVYAVDNRSDVVVEQAGGGVDTVRTTINSTTLGSQIENLTFTGTGGATLTGNSLDNVLRGGIGADVLNGGAGADLLFGGLGADTFVLRKGEAAGDCVTLDAGDQLRLEGFGRGAVLVENGATTASNDWCVSYNGGVEVLEINGRATLTEGTDFIFV